MIDWHRLIGLMLTDFFTGSQFQIELEKDLSVRQQLLDIIILRKGRGRILQPMPAGFEDLAIHNLLTYKSLHQSLDSWSIDELLGHYVNYRKQVSPSLQRLLPMKRFRLFAISTRDPKKLRNQVKLNRQQPGVYNTLWGINRVTVLVLSEMPAEPRNAVWELFSGVPKKVVAGLRSYRPHTPNISSVVNGLLEQYNLEGFKVPYTIDDFHRDYLRGHLKELTPEERLEGLSPEERLRGLSVEDWLRSLPVEERLRGLPVEERLRGLPVEERLRGLPVEERLRGLPVEERLRGLSPEQMRELEEYIRRRNEPNAS